ncbi:MAG TPA: CpaF family protein [Acidimicrobiia bacterium]|nr:CpaF family protein [Acidimicrobiia bacterium]
MTAVPASQSRGTSGDGALKQRVHRRLVAAGGLDALDHLDEHDRVGRALAVRTRLAELLRDEAPLLTPARFEHLLRDLTDEVSGLGPLEPLLADPEVSEVMLNGPGKAYVERAGRLEPVSLDLDAAGIVRLVERVVAPLGLRLDRASPMVDARLTDGSRLHALIPPLALDGPCVTIRRFRPRPVHLDAFGAGGAPGEFLCWAVTAGWNVLLSGGTSAGKTTLLNSLSAAIPSGERVVTIEETAELRLAQPHVVRLEARPPNAEGAGAVSVRDLVRTALRMRPDRIVVGEVRGGEALDMLQALNTGHDGSLSTVHANGPVDVLPRLETLVLMAGAGLPLVAVRSQIGAAIDAVVQVNRCTEGARRVEAIGELAGRADTLDVRPLFERRGGVLVAAGVPRRPPRRPDTPPPDDRWFAC